MNESYSGFEVVVSFKTYLHEVTCSVIANRAYEENVKSIQFGPKRIV